MNHTYRKMHKSKVCSLMTFHKVNEYPLEPPPTSRNRLSEPLFLLYPTSHHDTTRRLQYPNLQHQEIECYLYKCKYLHNTIFICCIYIVYKTLYISLFAYFHCINKSIYLYVYLYFCTHTSYVYLYLIYLYIISI